ncbi:HhH-GPD-type base excision DNA repair protein [Actinopolymorpha alba]|uniref:HhH-GPD-type base excision DNA repair protein n=1 Tax=Actinopolymorpha alba TaxID=533267 RepID=UPI00037827B9|nr:HhH-GPD-type base excision DNA repair protein [Actinopolymorpha alba]
MAISITGNAAADVELENHPFSLLTAMLLDQQFPMERAFLGPYVIVERLGGPLDPAVVAAYDPDAFAKLCTGPPAVHRYPGAMAGRIQTLAQYVLDEYDGDAARIWSDVATADELLRRLKALPGYGTVKATIFLALLGKQFGVRPEGWSRVTGGYGEVGVFRSVADVIDADSLAKVRAYKQEQKRAAKAGR